jgi:uncharacterized membrane protein (GlpM family)
VVIGLNFKALRQAHWHEYVLRFILGGTVTAMTGWLAGEFGPVLGGLFLAFPAIFPASATLLDKHEQDRKRAAGIPWTVRGRLAAALDARGAVMGAIGGLAFAVLVWRLVSRMSATVTLLSALAAWSAVSSLLWYARKHHPWARPKK